MERRCAPVMIAQEEQQRQVSPPLTGDLTLLRATKPVVLEVEAGPKLVERTPLGPDRRRPGG
jgi:hypothetical protein